MQHKRFVLRFLGLFGSVVLINALINFVINPYGIFEHTILEKGTYHNQRYEKINFLKANHHKFNAYLIGSSRVGLITPEKIESYIPNTKFYNAWVSSGNTLDADIFIDWILKNNYEVKYLFIQIGFDHAIYITDYRVIQDMQRLWHYEVTQSSPIDFYSPYIFGLPTIAMRRKITDLIYDPEIKEEENIQTGAWRFITREQERKQDIEAYIRNEPSFHKPIPTPQSLMPPIRIEMFTKALQNINQRCKAHQIQCIFVTAPLYHKKSLRYTTQLRDFVLEIISQALPEGFWHFSYLNSITTDERNFYEDIHQVPEVDTMVLKRIFRHDAEGVPSDFGMFITQENFAQSLQNIRAIEQRFNL